MSYAVATAIPDQPPYFEFQVDRPARFAGPDTMPYPDRSLASRAPYPPAFALAQFVVDAAGRPEIETLQLLVHPDAVDGDAVRESMSRWRYAPAMLGGAPVPQLVQTPLRWQP